MSNRIFIGKCPVDCITMSETLERILDVNSNEKHLLIAPVNAATVVDASIFLSFRSALKEFDILLPDGYWLQVASKLTGYPTTNHVATVPLIYQLLHKLSECRGTVYLLGTTEFTVNAAGNEICKRYPGVEITGIRNGYFSEDEEAGIINEINNSKAKILLIGISSPKRELFVMRNRNKIKVPVIIGVGGLLDIIGGKTPEGPNWLRNYGLMWIYRFAQEPKRMWRRYTITNFQFIGIVFKQAIMGTYKRYYSKNFKC